MSDKDYMKNLSAFIKNKYNKKLIDELFEDSVYISNIEDAEKLAKSINFGKSLHIVFENSVYKNRFINILSNLKPDINVINCNGSTNSFFENDFNGFLVFNNLKFCQHTEIIEEIKKHKGVLIS